MEKTETRVGSCKEVGEVFEKLMEVAIVFGKCVNIDNVESTNAEDVFTVHQVLPFSLQDFYTGCFMPSMVFHMLQNVRMRLNYDMLRRTRSEGLEEGIYLG
jgi:hypothetical protein